MTVDEIPKVARVHLQCFESRAVEKAEDFEFDVGQHFGRRTQSLPLNMSEVL